MLIAEALNFYIFYEFILVYFFKRYSINYDKLITSLWQPIHHGRQTF